VKKSVSTIADVASQAGVSVMTVSRVLNNRPEVAQKTRHLVLETVAALGYAPHGAAKTLKSGKTNVLGLVVPDLNSQYFTEIVRGASQAANRLGYDLSLYTTANGQHEVRGISALSHGIADGLALVLPRSSETYLRSLEQLPIPIVLLNHLGAQTHLPAVNGDNYLGARQAVEHLIGLGHRRIGFLSGSLHSGQSNERLRGYREALVTNGLEFNSHLVRQGDWSQTTAFGVTRAWLEEPDFPSAVFATNDFSAFGVIEAIKEKGWRVPDDVSVIGFDDVPMAMQVFPALTTVRHPLVKIGYTALHLLSELVEQREPIVRQILLQSELIVRDSSGQAR
jgi:LacI family transcriptional regulator